VILERAKTEKVDAIGLSGLITPSLDEMVHVAKEMERLGFKVPLLIGGATTSVAHTAVKISPAYSQPVVHVTDASRSVPTVGSLLSKEGQKPFLAELESRYQTVREKHAASLGARKMLPLEQARKNRLVADFGPGKIIPPKLLGVRTLKGYPLEDLVPFIDWTPFFQTWELAGQYPRILDDAKVGEEARKLHRDATALVDKIVQRRSLEARAV
jgi:5-methyltetrahydrofolate--homocysteine methyltransferase